MTLSGSHDVPCCSPAEPHCFRVFYEGRCVACFTLATGPTRVTEVITYRSGAEPLRSHGLPGVLRYDSITLERGVVYDREFEEWISSVESAPSANLRRDLALEACDASGQALSRFRMVRCWVSQYRAFPALRLVIELDEFQREC